MRGKCDEQPDEHGRCATCVRLRLECLGFGAKRPEWLRESSTVAEIREKIKTFLASQGMVKGYSGAGTALAHQSFSFQDTGQHYYAYTHNNGSEPQAPQLVMRDAYDQPFASGSSRNPDAERGFPIESSPPPERRFSPAPERAYSPPRIYSPPPDRAYSPPPPLRRVYSPSPPRRPFSRERSYSRERTTPPREHFKPISFGRGTQHLLNQDIYPEPPTRTTSYSRSTAHMEDIVPPVPTLNQGHVMSEGEKIERLITRLENLFANKSEYKALLSARGLSAQRLLDLFQRLLDVLSNPPPRFERHLIVATQRLAANSGLYPTCYELNDIFSQDLPETSGDFSDIYKGVFRERAVCLKAIRLYNSTNYEQFLQAFDVVQGLQFLHKSGIIHGDLKGTNVLINERGRACLTDFGFSSFSMEREIATMGSFSPVSPYGGTVRWQSPELFDPEKEDVRKSEASDIYAWACVAYEIFSGQIPFSHLNRDTVVITKVMSGERPTKPPSGSQSWGVWGLTEDIWAVMQSCWHHDPIRRPTAGMVIENLETALPIGAEVNANPKLEGALLPHEFRELTRGRQMPGQRGVAEDDLRVEVLEMSATALTHRGGLRALISFAHGDLSAVEFKFADHLSHVSKDKYNEKEILQQHSRPVNQPTNHVFDTLNNINPAGTDTETRRFRPVFEVQMPIGACYRKHFVAVRSRIRNF
ncbi:hypothetical protein H0H93_006946 [Arthromyces matolae]|nr:hypothetical protein H0H93_006946 [Arthromyces matolae]